MWVFGSDDEALQDAGRRASGSADRLSLASDWMRRGNFMQAILLYDALIREDPACGEAFQGRAIALRHMNPAKSAADAREALRLGAPVPSLAVLDPGSAPELGLGVTLYADITDMIDYLAVNTSFSGIQRVVANMLRSAAEGESANTCGVQAVIPDFIGKALYQADMSLVLEMIDAVEVYHAPRQQLDRLLAAVRASLRHIAPEPGSIFLMAGAFWISHNYDLLKKLRSDRVVVSIFVHDLIQINNVEYVEPAATDVFRRSLIDVLELANFITTNSEYVASEVRRFLKEDLCLEKPVMAIPLATEMVAAARDLDEEAMIRADHPNGYVLCVCTIEIRKNHVYLARLWERLMLEGRQNLPRLVFVGKWGWEIEPFRRYLHDTENLGGAIRVMSGVSDALLASLYRCAMFSIYPSFAEGWGLPIGESLVFGTPCVASGTTSMPEVGGDLVRYLDPLDLETGLALVRRLIDDPEELAAWRADVQARFRTRSWADFTAHLLDTSLSLARQTGDDPQIAYARLASGEMAVLGARHVIAAAGMRRTMRTARMARRKGWHHLENAGSWSSRPVSTLCFTALGCSPGERLHVSLELRSGSDLGLLSCSLEGGLGPTPFYHLERQVARFSCDAVVRADNSVLVSLQTRGHPSRLDNRDVFVHLSRMGFYAEGDNAGRVELMEFAVLYS